MYFSFQRKVIKDLPFKLGAVSLAVLAGVAQGIIITSAGILSGPGGAKRSLNKINQMGTFGDFYQEIYDFLKNLEENNRYVILYRLKKKGLIERKKKKYQLTVLGWQYFRQIKSDRINKKKWDGKWRIITFDIPEKIRREREWLRRQLSGAEYLSLQKSVFIGKWPLDEDLFKEITRRQLNSFIRIMTVGEIDDDRVLEAFNND